MSNGTFTETTDQSMKLLEDDVNTFSRFVQWLYQGQIQTLPLADENSAKCWSDLAELYVLADKYQMVHLHNDIINKLFEFKAASLQPPQIIVAMFIYENTTSGSSFRKLLVTYNAWLVNREWYSKEQVPFSLSRVPEFAADIACAFAQRLDGTHKSLFEDEPSKLYRAIKGTDPRVTTIGKGDSKSGS